MISRLVLNARSITATLLLFASGLALAQVNLEELFRNSKFTSASLSPNGKFLATAANIGGRLQLAVVEIATGAAKNVAGYEKLDVTDVQWVDDERLLYMVVDRDGEQSSTVVDIFAVGRDGSRPVSLLKRQMGRVQVLGGSTQVPGSVLAVVQQGNRDALPFRIDTLSARRKELDFQVDGLARAFVFDSKDRVRVVLITNAEQSQVAVWYVDRDGKEWRKLSEYPTFFPKFVVLGFDADDTTMIVKAHVDADRWGVFKYDFVNNRPGELLASDKSVDIDGGLVFAPDSRRLLGIRMRTEPPKTLWFDTDVSALQSRLDDAFPGMVNVIHPGNALAPMLILSYSSTHPGQYYLYHPDRKKVSPLFAKRPWIDPKKMSAQLAYDYIARDDLPILSYLTLPAGRAAKNLPMVVLVHGGPWGRDYWGFDPVVQMMAGLGYAVLQPQFRGSTGFGETHYAKSLKQWGLSMQDDVTDGVASLIKQGVVDSNRICIMGAGYGGYAAMMGLVRDPDFYRCAVNLFGPTNLLYLSSSETWGDSAMSYSRNMTLGDPKKLQDQFNATSPSKQAAKIKAPVLMFYGEKDRRVPRVHGEEMRDALKKLNKVYEYTELEGEEHGIADEKTRYRVFGAIESFLKKYNPAQ